jgi:hypothetical protein
LDYQPPPAAGSIDDLPASLGSPCAQSQRSGSPAAHLANQSRRALVGVMRKLALALYQVGAKGAAFAVQRLFPGRAIVPVGETVAAAGESSKGK